MKEGSNTKEGYIYHDLPGSNLPAHRTGTEKRARFILSKVKVKDKLVLDLGCSVGGISYYLAKVGGWVLGIDYDEEAVKIGNDFLKGKKVKGGVELFVDDITPSFISNLNKYNVIVWLSQWQWFVKQHGLEAGLAVLFSISKKCEILVFETAANDGRAKIEGVNQDKIEEWLIMNTAFSQIDRYKQDSEGWHERDLFICSKPVFTWRRHRGVTIKRTDRGGVEKVSEFGFLDNKMLLGICYLDELKDTPIVPKVLSISTDRYKMTYGGIPIKKLREEDIQLILKSLRSHRIIHRDITPSNLLWNGKNVVLIDFAWAIHTGEKRETPKDLGEGYRCPDGFNDEYSLRKIKEELDGKTN
jgi:SAM-dependent methyltransferase